MELFKRSFGVQFRTKGYRVYRPPRPKIRTGIHQHMRAFPASHAPAHMGVSRAASPISVRNGRRRLVDPTVGSIRARATHCAMENAEPWTMERQPAKFGHAATGTRDRLSLIPWRLNESKAVRPHGPPGFSSRSS